MAPNVGKVTFLLAEMQTRINAAGLRSFDDDTDYILPAEQVARMEEGRAVAAGPLETLLA